MKPDKAIAEAVKRLDETGYIQYVLRRGDDYSVCSQTESWEVLEMIGPGNVQNFRAVPETPKDEVEWTPEGALKVSQAGRVWDVATANYANAAEDFFDAYEHLFEDIASGEEGEGGWQDWKDLVKLRQERQAAQEAFLKAVKGWSEPALPPTVDRERARP